tara:strand:- start:705 stop:1613 length:909 start_codon:yes stop_codon:yes gene_type:complete
MKNGEIVETGITKEVFLQPRHPYTRHLLESRPKRKTNPFNGQTPTIMEAKNIRVWFPIKKGILRRTIGHTKAVDDVSLIVREGQTIGVVGESGSGKTTLAMALLRLQESKGVITFSGKRIDGFNFNRMRPLRKEMQVVFQDPFATLSPRLSVGQIIEEGLRLHKLIQQNAAERRKTVGEALEEVELSQDLQDRYPHEFSGGQRQRIAIARALALKPKLLIFDEPTSALDMSVQAQIINLLQDLQKKHGLAYIFISHDLKVIRAIADEMIIMQDGKVVEQGPANQLFENPSDEYSKTLIASAI